MALSPQMQAALAKLQQTAAVIAEKAKTMSQSKFSESQLNSWLKSLGDHKWNRAMIAEKYAELTGKGKTALRQSVEQFLPKDMDLSEEYIEIVRDEINVKEIIIDKSIKEPVLDTEITEDLRIEGMAREMVRKIQDLRKAEKLSISDRIKAFFEETPETLKVVEKHGAEIKDKILADSLAPAKEYSVEKI